MNGKGVSVLLGRLYSEFLCLLPFTVALLGNLFLRTICWDFMTGRDGCINEGRHGFEASKLLGQVGRQLGSLN